MEKPLANSVSRIISDETLSRGIQIESAGKPAAKARTSSATGLAQFIGSTWLAVIRAHRPDLEKTRTFSELLALRTDPSLSIELMARHWEDNGKTLGSYVDGDLYLAHFAGAGAALRVLRADQGRAVSEIIARTAIDANPSILRGKTCGQVRGWAARKMAGAGGHDWVAKWYRASGGKPADPLILPGLATPAGMPPTIKARRAAIVAGAIIVAFLVACLLAPVATSR